MVQKVCIYAYTPFFIVTLSEITFKFVCGYNKEKMSVIKLKISHKLLPRKIY